MRVWLFSERSTHLLRSSACFIKCDSRKHGPDLQKLHQSKHHERGPIIAGTGAQSGENRPNISRGRAYSLLYLLHPLNYTTEQFSLLLLNISLPAYFTNEKVTILCRQQRNNKKKNIRSAKVSSHSPVTEKKLWLGGGQVEKTLCQCRTGADPTSKKLK